jgi:hypothetical protein
MSHAVAIKTKISKDHLAELVAAAERCGLEFRPDQTKYKWFGKFVGDYKEIDSVFARLGVEAMGKCEHAFRVRDNDTAYELGIITDPEDPNSYALVYDFWGSYGKDLLTQIGQNGELLINQYNAEVAGTTAKLSGYREVSRTVQPNGSIVQEFEITQDQIDLLTIG